MDIFFASSLRHRIKTHSHALIHMCGMTHDCLLPFLPQTPNTDTLSRESRHTLTRIKTHSHAVKDTLSRTISYTHTHTHYSLSHTTLSSVLSLSHTHTHTHTNTHTGTGPYGGILGTMFTSKYYNDQPIPASDAGFLFSYNKLIGGVLLTQECIA